MGITHKLIVIGLLLLATLVTGFWQSNSGKSLPSFLFGVHKLLALAWVIFTGIVIFHSPRQIEYRMAFFTAIAVLGVSIIALFATCALLTTPQPKRDPWLTVHLIASIFAVIASAIMARLIIFNKP
jgi:hypothetical protein